MLGGPVMQESENNSFAEVFYRLDGSLPATAGSYPVTVTFTTNQYPGVGAFDIVELKNVQQVNPFVTTVGNGDNADCNGKGDRSAVLSFAQAGTWVYAITGARTGDTAAANPGFLVQTMPPQYLIATPFAAMAGYGGPSNGPATLTWNVQNCWNSASAGVALKRVGD